MKHAAESSRIDEGNSAFCGLPRFVSMSVKDQITFFFFRYSVYQIGLVADTYLPIVYPNPSRDIIFISSRNKISEIEVFDLFGLRIFSGKLDDIFVKINISSFTKGIYIIKINTSNGIVTKKIVVI